MLNDNLKFQGFTINDEQNSPFTASNTGYNNVANPPSLAGTMGDKNATETNTLKSTKPHFLSFHFYQRYFDVDTNQVQTRILNSMIPRINSNFITDCIQPVPDLYGPFWICVTLIFSIAIFGNFAHYIQGASRTSADNDFQLITGASSLIISYVLLVPFGIYSLLWYRKATIQYSYMELLCTYGYCLSIFIPVSMLWVIQIQAFRWSLIAVSVFLSGTVLVGSLWSAVRNDPNRLVSFGFIAGIILLHTLLAVAFKEFYFDTTMPSADTTHIKFHEPTTILPDLPTAAALVKQEKTDTKNGSFEGVKTVRETAASISVPTNVVKGENPKEEPNKNNKLPLKTDKEEKIADSGSTKKGESVDPKNSVKKNETETNENAKTNSEIPK